MMSETDTDMPKHGSTMYNQAWRILVMDSITKALA